MLADQLPMAEGEDAWDVIVSKELGLQEDQAQTWTDEIEVGLQQNNQLQVRAIKKRAEVAARMHAIVEQEKTLVAEEQHSIRTEKHQRSKIKRLARKGKTIGVAEQGQILSRLGPASDEAVPRMIIYDEEKTKTREEIEKIKAENVVFRTDVEVAGIKAARAKRKEEKTKAKEEKLKRRVESVEFWRKKLNKSNIESADAALKSEPHEGTQSTMAFCHPLAN